MSSMARPALPLAVATGVGTFAWYALPGAVASRPARAVAKTALAAGVTGVYALTRPRTEATNGPDRVDVLHEISELRSGMEPVAVEQRKGGIDELVAFAGSHWNLLDGALCASPGSGSNRVVRGVAKRGLK